MLQTKKNVPRRIIILYTRKMRFTVILKWIKCIVDWRLELLPKMLLRVKNRTFVEKNWFRSRHTCLFRSC